LQCRDLLVVLFKEFDQRSRFSIESCFLGFGFLEQSSLLIGVRFEAGFTRGVVN
jgi:hypothetical protein